MLLFHTGINIMPLFWMTGENALNANYLDKSWVWLVCGTYIVVTKEIEEEVV